MTDLGFHHVFLPGDADQPVLLLLHGTGGDEHDLIDLGQSVAPNATILSVRGKVLEAGMPRFFRRLAEGVFDLEDLKFRTDELADFIIAAKKHYELDDKPIYALGFSNGANIAASMFLQRPEVLDGAALIRAMIPFTPDKIPTLTNKSILILAGLMDPIIPREQPPVLAEMLEQGGAKVKLVMKPTGHGLIQSDVVDTRNWWSEITA